MKIGRFHSILIGAFLLGSLVLKGQQPSLTIPFQYANGTFDTVHAFYGNDPKLCPPIQLIYTHMHLGLPSKTWGPGTGGFYVTALKLHSDMKFRFLDVDLGAVPGPGYFAYQLGLTYESHRPNTVRTVKRSGPLEVVAHAGGPQGAIFSGEAVRMPFTTQKVNAKYWGLKREMLSVDYGVVYHAALLGKSWSSYSTVMTFQSSDAKTIRSVDMVRYKTAVILPFFSYGPALQPTTSTSPFIGATFEASTHQTVSIVNPYAPALRRLEQQGFMNIGLTMHPILVNNRPVFTIDFGGGAKLWSIGLHQFGRETVRLGERYYQKKVQTFDRPF